MAQKSLAPEQEHTEAGHPGWHPRWWFCGTFVVLAAIQLSDGWSTTDAIGLPLGFACSLALVFVRRLPGWVTGEWSPRPWSRQWLPARRNRLTCALGSPGCPQ